MAPRVVVLYSFDCICLSVILIASVYRKDKNYWPQMFLEKCKYVVKEKKMSKFITDKTGISSDDSDREDSDKYNSDEEKSDQEHFNEEN